MGFGEHGKGHSFQRDRPNFDWEQDSKDNSGEQETHKKNNFWGTGEQVNLL